MNSKNIFENLNRGLMNDLIPSKDTPIFGNSFANPNEPIFNKSLEQIKSEVLNEFLDAHEFLNELEQIKHNLNS